jgi:thiol-disulfide isomerase/thioredoxin
MKQIAMIIFVAIIALGLGIAARDSFSPAKNTGLGVLPEFNLSDLSGHQHNISEWRGKVVLINFWATWCPPCREEIPDFIALQQQYADKGVQFIGIALDDMEPVAEYAASAKINYPILLGGDNGITLAQQLGNSVGAVPYTLIVDREGQIIHQHPGGLSKQQIMEIISPLLN